MLKLYLLYQEPALVHELWVIVLRVEALQVRDELHAVLIQRRLDLRRLGRVRDEDLENMERSENTRRDTRWSGTWQ